MNRIIAILLGTIIGVSPIYADGETTVWPDCYCTDKSGQRIELGEEICLSVGERNFMARCEMSLNNPMWRETGSDCLSSQTLPQSRDPLAPKRVIYPTV